MVLLLLALFSTIPANALLIDHDKIMDTSVDDKISQLELQSRKIVAVSVVPSTATPFGDGTVLLQQRQADIVIVYQYQNNKLSIIQPVDAWLQDKDVRAVLDAVQQEGQEAVATEQKKTLLLQVLDGLSPLLLRAKDTRSYCQAVKDGYCDPKCEGTDLDCLCGDATCQYHETIATCADDCRQEQGRLCAVFRDGICDENCRQDLDCGLKNMVNIAQQLHDQQKIGYDTMMGVLLAIFLVVASVLGYLLHLEKKEKMKK